MGDTENRRGGDGDGSIRTDGGGGEIDGGDEVHDGEDSARDGDTFGVGIHVTEAEFQFVVHVPADIDSGWTDPDAFQRLVERTVWDRLDREATLRGIAREASVGDTVTLGRVTLHPDETVVETEFREPAVES
ncbi:hypothetical protein [Halobellus litoreus]|uniref:DUF8124 domain-containing protein n=1 Tax=Halobellus litoreus TaxID=755310 RepID=A0ABD6DZE1_9EURY|nr:hypothetical protein [Halobellus litoreus]